jgi:hypothetical protein
MRTLFEEKSFTYMSGENPKSDTRGHTPLARPKRCHGQIGNDGGVVHHVDVVRRSERINLRSSKLLNQEESLEILTNILSILAGASKLGMIIRRGERLLLTNHRIREGVEELSDD